VRLDGNRGFETILVTDADDPSVEHWWPPGHVLGWDHLFVHENYEFLSAIAEESSHEPNFDDGVAVQSPSIAQSDENGSWSPSSRTEHSAQAQ